MSFKFNKERAKEIFPRLIDHYKKRKYIYQFDGLFPEIPIPSTIQWGSEQHWNYWFIATMTDHAVVSRRHYPMVRAVYELISQVPEIPNIFDPKIAAELDLGMIKRVKNIMHCGANNHPAALKENSQRLVLDYASHPGNIFEDLKGDSIQSQEVLQTFRQFGEGVSGLYLTFLHKRGVYRFRNPEDIKVKIDHHDIRISEALGVLEIDGDSMGDEVIGKPLARFFCDISKELGIDVLDLDSALWALGAYGCSKTDEAWCLQTCSMYEECDRENMFGSYYMDGKLHRGQYWKRKRLSSREMFDGVVSPERRLNLYTPPPLEVLLKRWHNPKKSERSERGSKPEVNSNQLKIPLDSDILFP